MSNLVAVNDMQVMADSIVKSGFYGFKNKEQVMAVMLVAQAEGKHPATVVQEYDIIQGRPALKSQAMLARFQMSGGKVEWHEVSPNRCSGTFSHPQGGSLRVEWTIEMAKTAGVFREGSGWTKYPEDMLTARVISRAVRKVFPACILGHYAVEEVIDFEPKRTQTPQPVDMGAVERVDEQIGEFVEQDDGAFHIYLPNGEVHSSYHTPDEWISAYADMVQKVTDSPKITGGQKEEKLKDFAKANEKVTSHFDSFSKVKLKGAIVNAGGTANPKSEQSPSSPSLKPNEEEFSNT